ncbi:MAG: LysM peptidoglycan-binding domain-containing protein [Actinobacteria bacterium]|nr:LysM peptidoglycan-binding domain-containing protein [Actinomycetota bacterium]
MHDSDRRLARGSELVVGLLVVAFFVFLLWFLLIRPRETRAPAFEATPIPAATAPIIDEPNRAFERVIATPTPEPTPTATPQPRPTPSPTPLVYSVRPGDSLSAIAARFGVTVEALVQANRIVNPDSLSVGQPLTIPSPGPG